MRLLTMSIWFQLLWLLAVIGQEQTQWWLMLCVIATYLYVLLKQSIPLERLFILGFLGIAVDWFNMRTHLLSFDSEFLPTWLISLWFIFAWYAYNLVPALRPFSSWLLIPIGGLLGASSYFAGYKLEAVALPHSLSVSLSALFIEWSLIMLVILKVIYREQRSIR
ncbi:DUF2878 domain-containing protein [Vibrio olivae]|uniref:DUF2878 domain-containing protein n=1 Tax=Vibrio olivae TaxID=1243002 RepID=A0ABV5HJJ8_9VIBR